MLAERTAISFLNSCTNLSQLSGAVHTKGLERSSMTDPIRYIAFVMASARNAGMISYAGILCRATAGAPSVAPVGVRAMAAVNW